jgi:hypothetical protein
MASGTRRPGLHLSREGSEDLQTDSPLAPDTDAAMVLGMAATAMPFAPTVDAEAERWLRILRLYGDAGSALQGLGVSEAPLEALATDAEGTRPAPPRPDRRGVVTAVTEQAIRAAGRRGAHTIGTSDVFVAVMQVYGRDFDRVLWAHGTDSAEVLERLGVRMPEAGPEG